MNLDDQDLLDDDTEAFSDVSDQGYNTPARFFHWGMAILIFGLLAVGLYMVSMAPGPEKFQLYGLHKSFGLLVLWLVGLRFVWRHVSGVPEPLSTHQPWEKRLALGAHVFLYIAMLGLPLSGWLMSSAGEYPVSFFGLPMPALMAKNEFWFGVMKETHEILGFILMGVIALHGAGAFKHHFLDRDSTLDRMLPQAKRWAISVLGVMAVMFLVYGALMLGEEEEEDSRSESTQVIETSDYPTKELAPHEWQIIPAQSRLTITASMSGTPFEGEFKDFDGTIFFNPQDMSLSRVSIVINIASLGTGSLERDQNIGNTEWFDVVNFPSAIFESVEFAQGEGNNYVAIGNLTIKGVTLPMTLPFKLDITQNKKGNATAKMSGTASINRLDYGVGQGQWENTDTIADAVTIGVSVTAVGSP